MKPRDERGHPVVKDAIDQGYVDTGKPYPVHGLPTHEAANQARKTLKLAGDHLGVAVSAFVVNEAGEPCWKAGVPGYVACQGNETPHGVYFRVWSKDNARAHVLRQSGGDISKLKYNPFARAETRIVDDSGRRI